METVVILIAGGREAEGALLRDHDLLPKAAAVAGGRGEPRWLAPGRACEWTIEAGAAELRALEEQVRSALGDLPIDVAVLPAEGRRKPLLIADMDSTMIGQECIDELAAVAGVGDQIAAITERAMRGELDFEGALRTRVGMLKGLPRSAIATVISQRLSFTAGGDVLLRTMRQSGAFTALVSGGFTAFTSHVADHLGFDHARANELLLDGDMLSGTVAEPILGRDAKASALRELCERLDISPAQALAVGDGANDIPMLEAAGLGVAFHAKPKTRDAAAARIDFGDLTSLLFLQGYSVHDFR